MKKDTELISESCILQLHKIMDSADFKVNLEAMSVTDIPNQSKDKTIIMPTPRTVFTCTEASFAKSLRSLFT